VQEDDVEDDEVDDDDVEKEDPPTHCLGSLARIFFWGDSSPYEPSFQ
jgi:hypothetical protein